MIVKCCLGEDWLNLNVDECDVSVGSQCHLWLHMVMVSKLTIRMTPTWKVNDPPAGCSASVMTETLLHSTVHLSGRLSTEMVELLLLLGSS